MEFFNSNNMFVHKLVSCVSTDDNNFSCEVRVNLKSKDDFLQWLKHFEATTKTSWVLRTSVSSEKSCYVLSRDYLCQHSSYNKQKIGDNHMVKNKKCGASLKVRIKQNTKYSRCRDHYVKEGLDAVININFHHSHLINVPEALRWLKRSDETRECFIGYFNHGMSPIEAKRFHENILSAEGSEKLADASMNPPQRWVYYAFELWRKCPSANKTQGNLLTPTIQKPSSVSQPMILSLEEDIEEYNEVASEISENMTGPDFVHNGSDTAEKMKIVEHLKKCMENMCSVVKANIHDKKLMNAASLFLSCHEGVDLNSPENVLKLLHGMSLGCDMVFGREINVQPTAKCEPRY